MLKNKKKIKIMKTYTLIAGLFITLLACSVNGPEPIKYGTDNCGLCKMTIMDKKFGAELITSKGKVFKFDSDECLKDYVKADPSSAHTVYVTDYYSQKLVDGKTAFYLHSLTLKSPMGGNLAAFGTKADAEKEQKKNNGEIWTWAQLLTQ